MGEEQLDGGNAGGAIRIGDTVRRASGPWTPAVHHLLRHLRQVGFTRAPEALDLDDQGREVLSFLPGHTVGSRRPWPAWVHTDAALIQVARWLRDYHAAVADYVPPADARWREGGAWHSGLIIAQNDAAPYNAAWDDAGSLVGFFDWDFAGPVSPESDLAFTAFAWVPLHARHVVEAEGFTDFDGRARRLRLFLGAYGWSGDLEALLHTMKSRVLDSAEGIERIARRGDPVFERMRAAGVAEALRSAAAELEHDLPDLVRQADGVNDGRGAENGVRFGITEPAHRGDERTTLLGMLQRQRDLVTWKVRGAPDSVLAEATTPSGMSLHGLVRHLTNVERSWIRDVFAGEPGVQFDWTDDDPEAEWQVPPGTTMTELLAVYAEETRRCDAVVNNALSLDEVSAKRDMSLRWILLHLIEETSRHLGHIDLLREQADGSTGEEPED